MFYLEAIVVKVFFDVFQKENQYKRHGITLLDCITSIYVTDYLLFVRFTSFYKNYNVKN